VQDVQADPGIDTVKSSVTFSLDPIGGQAAGDVETLILTGRTSINGTGNDTHNLIIGNGGKNSLVGGSGDDTLIGVSAPAGYPCAKKDVPLATSSGEGVIAITASDCIFVGGIANLVWICRLGDFRSRREKSPDMTISSPVSPAQCS
jgi:Ca2+-binding RTX toxin-like protein